MRQCHVGYFWLRSCKDPQKLVGQIVSPIHPCNEGSEELRSGFFDKMTPLVLPYKMKIYMEYNLAEIGQIKWH